MILSRRGRKAFRLNDLVACVVLGVLVLGLFAPAAEKPRDAAARTACQNNLKMLGLSVHNYASAYQSKIPALTCDVKRPKYGAYNGNMFFSLLPFLEQEQYFETGLKNPKNTWYAATAPATTLPFSTTPPGKDGTPLSSHPFDVFQCPADRTIVKGLSANQTYTHTKTTPYYFPWAASSYAANFQVFGTMNQLDGGGDSGGNFCAPVFNIGNIPDGTSNTIFFGEQFAACGSSAGSLWAYPGIGNYSDKAYTEGAPAPHGANGLSNTEKETTGKYWAPVFANSSKKFGFAEGGIDGSIFRHHNPLPEDGKAGKRDKKPIAAPYAANRYWDAPPQVDIKQAQCDKSRLQSFHPSGLNIGMGDGSVRFVTGKVTQPTWYSAVCPADGYPLGADW
jgi:prepilin-type processing-associated H-X9-DG protein